VYAEKIPGKLSGDADHIREFVMEKVLKGGADEDHALPELGRRSKKQSHALSAECMKVGGLIKGDNEWFM